MSLSMRFFTLSRSHIASSCLLLNKKSCACASLKNTSPSSIPLILSIMLTDLDTQPTVSFFFILYLRYSLVSAAAAAFLSFTISFSDTSVFDLRDTSTGISRCWLYVLKYIFPKFLPLCIRL